MISFFPNISTLCQFHRFSFLQPKYQISKYPQSTTFNVPSKHGPWSDQQRKKICWTTINGRRRLQNQPRFYRACRLLANWRRTEKSKRKREREREVSTRPLIPLWDAIIVRERMQWETTAPRRTTGSEGALIKLKNIVAARLLEHSKDTEAGKTDRETDGGENLATYVHTQEKENHLWERASIWERERERYFFRELIRDERSRWKGPKLGLKSLQYP